MKLRNKETGEIGNLITICAQTRVFVKRKSDKVYNSLAELNEEWEDYEEPKEYWYIDPMVCGVYCTKIKKDEDLYDFNKQIGNYFESKEEAEKAVEKLKALQRLQNKGFEFCGHDDRDRGQLGDIVIYAEMPTFEYDDDSTRNDLDLLFGGKDE